MINLRSDRAKRRAWIVFDRVLKRFEKIIYKKSRSYIRGQYTRAAEEVGKGLSADRAIVSDRRRLELVLASFYKSVMTAFGNMILNENTKIKDISTRTIFWNKIIRWIRDNTARKVTMIDETTQNVIKRIIRKGIRDGLSNRDIADLIIARTDIDSMIRAIRIARTETHQSANKGSLEMAKEIKMAFKEWLSAKDARTRDQHRAANGQEVGIDEKFQVGGEELECPGDVDGSAWNIINCRCAMVFHGPKEEG